MATETPKLVARCRENRTQAYVVLGMPLNPELGLFNQFTVRTRFDDGKSSAGRWTGSTDNVAVFAPSAITFLRRLGKAETLKLEVTPFNSGRGVITFNVAGFEPHLEEIAQACGWKP
jgi:hypothetical protein